VGKKDGKEKSLSSMWKNIKEKSEAVL